MASPKRLLIVYHTQTGNTQRLLEAVERGARDPAISHLDVVAKSALLATPEDVLGAQGILLGTPENFGYMSGAMKYFFDHVYYPCLEHTQGLPYGLFIRAGNDGRGALMSIERIVAGLRWKLVCEPVIAAGELQPWHFEACEALGTTLAAGLEAGVF
jgi:multimeric flavodoxin WrbA